MISLMTTHIGYVTAYGAQAACTYIAPAESEI